MNNYQRKKRAFTLVEVLVVVVIIGILFLVVMSRVDFTTDAARESGVDTVLNSYQLAANAVGLDRAGFTEDLSELVAQLNKRLDSELQLSVSGDTIVSSNTDPWGTEFRIEHYKPYKSNGELRFTSAGPDETFDTADDIILVSRYDTSTGRGEMVNEHPVNDPYHTHKFTQQIQDAAYLCEEANCVSPTLYFNVCECGAVGTTYFSVGSNDTSKHGEKIFSYASLNEDQHTITSTCKRCKMQLSTEPVNHTFDDELSMCVVCGEVVNHTHNYIFMVTSEEFIVTPADCTNAAVYYYSCSCGAMSDETFEEGVPMGHNVVNGGTKEIHTHCDRCNTTLSVEHAFTTTTLYESTCTSLGSKKLTCNCGYTYTETIELKPHTPGSDPTCLQPQYCTVCNTVIMNEYGHSPSNVGIENIHSQCTRCGYITSTHTYNTEVFTPATCIDRGVTKYWCECGYNYTDADVAINPSNHAGEEQYVGTLQVHSQYSCCNLLIAANHDYEKVVIATATCQNPGETMYVCVCGYSYSIDEEQTDHVWGAEATCTTAQVCVHCGTQNVAPLGHDEQLWGDISVHSRCSRCDLVMSNTHNYVLDEHSDSTCVSYGRDEFICECGAWYSEELPLADHTPKRGADCTQATVCDVCGTQLAAGSAHILSYDNASASLHGICTVCGTEITEHIFVVREYARATCTTYKQMEESCVCGYSHVYSDTVSGMNPNVHTGIVISGGTESVHQKYNCCNATYSTNHTYTSTITTAPTCTSEGVRTFTCSCGHSYTTSVAKNYSNHADDCSIILVGEEKKHSKWSQCNVVAETAHTYTTETIPSTCSSFGKIIRKCKCGYKYETALTSYDETEHEGDIVFGGTEAVHQKYSCCNQVVSSKHTYTVQYSKKCGEAAVGTCVCNYQKTESPILIQLASSEPATCTSARKVTHYQYFETFPYKVCSKHSEGDKKPNNHTKGTIPGNAPKIHEKYECCGKVVSTSHSYTISYTYNGAKATGTAQCSCGYSTSATATGIGNIIKGQTCTNVSQTQYNYSFSSPFSSHSKVINGTTYTPHKYTYTEDWERGNWSDKLFKNHKSVVLTATCTECARSYTHTVSQARGMPNALLDLIFDACEDSNRIEYFVFPEMLRYTDNLGNKIYTTTFRCYTGAQWDNPCAIGSHRISTGVIGHSIQSYDTRQPVSTVSHFANCSSAGLVYTCSLCDKKVTYVGSKITSGEDWQAAINHFRSTYGTKQYCIYLLSLDSNQYTSMYTIYDTHSSVYKYRLFYYPETGSTYTACSGHSSRR